MKQLYTELQEAGWKEKDIKAISKKVFTINEDEYMEQQEIDEREERIRNEPNSEGYN